jgi:hypothetical protein
MAVAGMPGATMSDTHGPGDHPGGAYVPDQHGTSHAVEGDHGAATDHGEGHGHDDHGHPAETLGPIDWPMWGIGALGVVVGLIVAAGFWVASGFSLSA